jgi:hypothetical protein
MSVPSAIVGRILLLSFLAIASLGAAEFPNLSDELNDLEYYYEYRSELEETLEKGIYINTCSEEILRLVGFTDDECTLILKFRKKKAFENYHEIRKLLSDSLQLETLHEYLNFFSPAKFNFILNNKGTYSESHEDFTCTLKQSIFMDDYTARMISFKDYQDKRLNLLKSFSISSGNQNSINYMVGDYYSHFGRGLLFQAPGKQSIGYYSINSPHSEYYLQGFGVSYLANDFYISPFCGNQRTFPSTIAGFLNDDTGSEDIDVRTYNLILSWKNIGLLTGYFATSSEVGKRDYYSSVSGSQSSGPFKVYTEVTLEESPSISGELQVKTAEFTYKNSIELIRSADRHIFSGYYNNFHNLTDFQEYRSSILLSNLLLTPLLKLRYRSAGESKEVEEQLSLNYPTTANSIRTRVRHRLFLPSKENMWTIDLMFEQKLSGLAIYDCRFTMNRGRDNNSSLIFNRLSMKYPIGKWYIQQTSVSTEKPIFFSNGESELEIETLSESKNSWQTGCLFTIKRKLSLQLELKGHYKKFITGLSLNIVWNSAK